MADSIETWMGVWKRFKQFGRSMARLGNDDLWFDTMNRLVGLRLLYELDE